MVDLSETQFLVLEIGPGCNLGKEHEKCPTLTRKVSKEHLMTDDMIVNTAIQAYQKYNFTGPIAWHYYNEPMIYRHRMLSLMERIRELEPKSLFLLWTNGTFLINDERMKMFDQIHCTDYHNNPNLESYFKQYRPNPHIFKSCFDNRLFEGLYLDKPKNYRGCQRSLIEMIFDAWGTCHLCCQDWSGKVDLGNLWDNTFEEILIKRQEVIDKTAYSKMTEDAPERCLKCSHKCGSVGFYPLIAQKAQMKYGIY